MSNGHLDPNSPLESLQRRQGEQLSPVTSLIDAKARELSELTGEPDGGYDRVPGGFKRRYQGCTIYYGPATGVHEVHGAIRDKYEVLNGPSSGLGLPVTDEQCVGDGIGRFSDFEYGSIYWAPHTGPMMLRKEIRDAWRASGGPLGTGYPVRDQYHVFAPTPQHDPHIAWVSFENGIFVQTPEGVAPALAAILTSENLRRMIRSRVDYEMHQSPENVGLHAPTEIVNLSGWLYGFWASERPQITIMLHGFRDNGVLPDTNFDIRMTLEFKLVWTPTTFAEPGLKSLIAELVPFLRVIHEDGADEVIPILPGAVIEGVARGLHRAFFPNPWPDPAHPDVPQGAVWIADIPTQTRGNIVDVMDVWIGQDGSLMVFVNPLPSSPVNFGIARRNEAQRMIDALAAE